MPAAAAYVRRPRAPPFVGFARHRPENTLLFSSSSSTIQHSARCVPWQVARGKGKKPQAEEGAEPRATPRPVEMNWARRLKRVFGVDIESCARCGGKLAIIASIEEPAIIAKILAHLECMAPDQYQAELPLGAPAPPGQVSLL
jgi:hypothetical protein